MSKAGIIILPDMLHEKQYNNDKSSGGDEESEIVRDVQKWPKKTVLLDTDMFEVDDSWHDTPPEGFSLTVSILEKKRSSNFTFFFIQSQHDNEFLCSCLVSQQCGPHFLDGSRGHLWPMCMGLMGVPWKSC